MRYMLNTNNLFISFLSIGSNVGKKKINLDKCLKMLTNDNKTTILNQSSYYDTQPLYNENQNNFVNIVIKVQTEFLLTTLFEKCKLIETAMGRNLNNPKNYPRIIDVDILTFDNPTNHLDLESIQALNNAMINLPLVLKVGGSFGSGISFIRS